MRDEYDLGTMKPRKNPYVRRLKKQITIRIGEDVIDYFKQMAEDTGLPYQRLIDLYLRDCLENRRELKLRWEESA